MRFVDPDGMEPEDWYKDKFSNMKFDASVKTQTDVNKVSPGGIYQGAEVKEKGATYFNDGSAFFSNETKAYQFMVNNSNFGQGPKKEIENYAWLTSGGAAVLPMRITTSIEGFTSSLSYLPIISPDVSTLG